MLTPPILGSFLLSGQKKAIGEVRKVPMAKKVDQIGFYLALMADFKCLPGLNLTFFEAFTLIVTPV